MGRDGIPWEQPSKLQCKLIKCVLTIQSLDSIPNCKVYNVKFLLWYFSVNHVSNDLENYLLVLKDLFNELILKGKLNMRFIYIFHLVQFSAASHNLQKNAVIDETILHRVGSGKIKGKNS